MRWSLSERCVADPRGLMARRSCERWLGDQKMQVTRMAWIKATDIAYGRLRAPDLDVMEEFLTRFGMVRAERTNTALYMRGTDPPPSHPCHRERRAEIRGSRLLRRERGRSRAPRARARRLTDRGHRRARRWQTGAAHRAQRLSDRSRARHR